MAIGWSAAVLIGCVAVAVICIVAGAIRAALAARALRAHVERLKATSLISDVAEARVYLERINAGASAMEALLARANAALASIRDSLQQLRVPEAAAALRVAGASIRLLLSGR